MEENEATQRCLQPAAPSAAGETSPSKSSIQIHPKCRTRSGTSQEPGLRWKKVPAQPGLWGQPGSSLGAQPQRAKRGQAGGPVYVMGFTGHQLSILLFTLFSLAKCKRFFPLDCGKVKQGHLQPSGIQT